MKSNLACHLFLAFIPLHAAAADELPKARTLIAEVLRTCGKPTDDNWSPRANVAVALGHLGDIDAARKILAEHKNDSLVETGYWKLAEIEIERSGVASPFPPALFRELPDWPHLILARAYITHGHVEKALKHVRQMAPARHSTLHQQAQQIVQPLKAGGHDAAAREVLVRWATCLSKSESIYDYRHVAKIEKLILWLTECGEKARAKELCERWRAVLAAVTDVNENGEFIGRGWAQLGTSLAAIGESEGARDALRQARLWLDKARTATLDPEKPHQHIEYAAAYASVAARISSVLEVEAGETYELAYHHALMTVLSKYESYAYEKIVAEQLEADDEAGARRTLDRVLHPRSRARIWQMICDCALEHGNADTARSAARSAAEQLDDDGFAPFMAHDMAKVAASVALAGEPVLAQRLFLRAIGLSERNEAPKFDHSWIAGMQVKAGLLREAYETIKSIPYPANRISPLAELAGATAKAEYGASKKMGNK